MSIKTHTVAESIVTAARERAATFDPRDRYDSVTLRALLNLTAEPTGHREVTVTGPARTATTVSTWDDIVRRACAQAIDLATGDDTELHGYTGDGHITDPGAGLAVVFTW
jgi:hypothetical protein